jgi:Ca2+-binding EF-hand superfamily protein
MLKTTSMIILVSSVNLALPAMSGQGMGPGMGHHMMKPEGGFMMMMDENQDQAVSREEFENRQNARFKEADENGDGKVSHEEFTEFLEEERERRREMREQHMFNRLDSDGDGVISKEETSAHSQQMFGRMDQNGDGKIDAADRPGNGKWKGRGDGMGMKGQGDN